MPTINGNSGSNYLRGTTADDLINGLLGNDTLDGGGGRDTLDGGLGTDWMYGGQGDDTYVVDDAADRVIELPFVSDGFDLVQASVTFTLPSSVEALTLTGHAAIDGQGNELDNLILGNADANVLEGLGGHDDIRAGEGRDSLEGGSGNDSLWGDGGMDTLIGGAGDDWLDGGDDADLMRGGAGNDLYRVDNLFDRAVDLQDVLLGGTDTVMASVHYTLAQRSGIERLELMGSAALNGGGNELANTLAGNMAANRLSGGAGADSLYGGFGSDTLNGDAGNDWLDGGDGADVMRGGAGDDVYIVESPQDSASEASLTDNGVDEVRSTVSIGALGTGIERLTLLGSADLDGRGNGGDNRLSGNHGNNQLFGGHGKDTLLGGDGDDRLDGDMGVDRLDGGSGDDTYVVDETGDLVFDAEGARDTVFSAAVEYRLLPGNGIEDLILLAGAQRGQGNEQDNLMAANDQGNQLRGDGGNDTLLAGDGDDWLIGGTGSDRFVFASQDAAQGDLIDGLDAGDRIDLSGIDANPSLGGDQGFVFIGDAPFDPEAYGQVRYVGNHLEVWIDPLDSLSHFTITVNLFGNDLFSVDNLFL